MSAPFPIDPQTGLPILGGDPAGGTAGGMADIGNSSSSAGSGFLGQLAGLLPNLSSDAATIIRALTGTPAANQGPQTPNVTQAGALSSVGRYVGPALVGAGAEVAVPAILQGLFGGGATVVAQGKGYRIESYTTPSGKTALRYWVSRGRPVLYSGDIASVRRVQRVARRVRGAARGRRRSASPGRVICGTCANSPCTCMHGHVG